ncbi:MAG: antibiotic biosynthesis monooxygenase [Bacteroidia bacterium]
MLSTFDPPYYAVIFSSVRREADTAYDEMTLHMAQRTQAMPGYLGAESYRLPDGSGVTISYWRTLEDVQYWRSDMQHRAAQDQGRAQWYSSYRIRVCRVAYDYGFDEAGQLL